jgi:hypothetical protein
MGLDTKTYWLTDRQSKCDFDFDIERASRTQNSHYTIWATPAAHHRDPVV